MAPDQGFTLEAQLPNLAWMKVHAAPHRRLVIPVAVRQLCPLDPCCRLGWVGGFLPDHAAPDLVEPSVWRGTDYGLRCRSPRYWLYCTASGYGSYRTRTVL